MKILESPSEMRKWRNETGAAKSVGFVPTMGALHDGHASLLRRARSENDLVVLSIFVNPTQFNDPSDFSKYPKTWDADLKIAGLCGVDAIFAPNRDVMYPDDYRYQISENEFSKLLCGASRAGHFDGVLTVVMKLFQIVAPSKAYFGEKDFQQLQLIKGMVDAFFLPLEIVPVATLREKDGLAMSSRNQRLSPEERERAPRLHDILVKSKDSESASRALAEAGFRVDYVTDIGPRRFAAAFLGEVRLIDNVELATK